MNFDRLKRQLNNELRSNPKKSGALCLLLLVGCYFWIPLFLGSDEDESPSIDAHPSPVTAPAPYQVAVPLAMAATNKDDQEKPDQPWDKLAEAMDRDPRKLSMSVSVLARNPFDVGRVVEEKTTPQEQQLETKQVQLTPEDAGLVLSSTIVGPRRSMASINGKIYSTGDEIETEDGIVFHLRRVESRRIILERRERQYVLAILDTEGSPQIVVRNEE